MNLPADFEQRTRCLLGEEAYTALRRALADMPPVSIRLNPRKSSFAPASPDVMPVDWSASGYYLPDRPPFTFDPQLHAGCYYVQEAASMFVEEALRQLTGTGSPVRALDLCGAPGGKSLAALAALPAGSLLVANEPVPTRARVLEENMLKWGNPNVILTNSYPDAFSPLGELFHLVIADMPCSGEGMFRKDADAIAQWSVANVRRCSERQRSIVREAWQSLLPGGFFLYSTCTYNKEENEDNIAWMIRELSAEPVAIDCKPAWRIAGNLSADRSFPVYRFLPHQTRGEGFFLSILRKRGTSSAFLPRPKTSQRPIAALPQCRTWLAHEDTVCLRFRDTLYALPQAHADMAALLSERLRVLSAGTPFAQMKGHVAWPHPALALSQLFRQSAFPAVALDYPTAIACLRGEALTFPPDAPRGFITLTYRGAPLGFVKNIGARANNLYPSTWKIRSSHTPKGFEGLTLGAAVKSV